MLHQIVLEQQKQINALTNIVNKVINCIAGEKGAPKNDKKTDEELC